MANGCCSYITQELWLLLLHGKKSEGKRVFRGDYPGQNEGGIKKEKERTDKRVRRIRGLSGRVREGEKKSWVTPTADFRFRFFYPHCTCMRLYVDDDDDAKSYYVTGEALLFFFFLSLFFRWKTTAATKWGDPFRRGYYIRHFGVGWFLAIDCLNEKYRFEKCVIIFLYLSSSSSSSPFRIDSILIVVTMILKEKVFLLVLYLNQPVFFYAYFSWLLAYLERVDGRCWKIRRIGTAVFLFVLISFLIWFFFLLGSCFWYWDG